jgi:hypothetical protein
MRILSLPCSFYPNTFSKPKGSKPLKSLFDGSLKKEKVDGRSSEALDKWLYNRVQLVGKDKDYQEAKVKQCALTPSGLFEGKRSYETLKQAHPILVVDFDDVVPTKKLLDSYKKFGWVVGAGQSSSRQGYFVVVYTATTDLKAHFAALQKLWPSLDPLKDTTRLRYLAYGYSWCREPKEAYSEVGEVEPVEELEQLPPTTQYDTEKDIQQLIELAGPLGSLHPWQTSVATMANQRGVSRDYGRKAVWNAIVDLPVIQDTERYTVARFNKDWNDVYKRYAHQHHTQSKSKVAITGKDLKRFDKSIYDRCPKIMKELLGVVKQDEEKEVVFFASLILLGTLFPNRHSRYFNNDYFINLYGYIIGDAASFKGKAKVLRTALKPYQHKIVEVRKAAIEQRTALIAYNKSLPKDQKDKAKAVDPIPELTLFFDGNTSSAAMLTAMQDSPLMVLFETEGDTISKTWGTDWGNYSDILRKAFEHEVLNSFKKGGKVETGMERIYIESPRLSVLVSSTQNQMQKILSSDETENGLLSRFLFYIVKNDKSWYNGFEDNTTESLISEILIKHVDVEVWYNSFSRNKVFYTVSEGAQVLHQEYFKRISLDWPNEIMEIISVSRRAGPATIRIAMLLEELFALEESRSGLVAKSHVVGSLTMRLALDIVNILLTHLIAAWQGTRKNTTVVKTNIQDESTRLKIRSLLRENPSMSLRDIEKEVGVAKSSVARIKNKMKAEGLFD